MGDRPGKSEGCRDRWPHGTVPLPGGIEVMRGYLRPRIPEEIYTDPDGARIHYGSRWPESPPQGSYSVNSNLERFEGLHAIARELIRHLSARFETDMEIGSECAADLIRPHQGILDAVRLTPRNSRAASLTFVFTDFPGLVVHAGALHDFLFPVCGCDACDDTAERLGDDLEQLVFGVAAGGYAERYSADAGNLHFSLHAADGSGARHGTQFDAGPVDMKRLERAARTLQAVPDGWEAWTLLPGFRT